MNLLTQALHVLGSGAVAYVTAANLRDRKTRPNMLAGLQLAESGSVPFLEALRDRAEQEGDRWLADKLAKHAQDERRHGQIFAHALKQLDKQAIDLKSVPKTTAEELLTSVAAVRSLRLTSAITHQNSSAPRRSTG